MQREDATISGYDSESSLRHVHCPRCGKVIAKPKELIEFWKTQEKYHD